MGLATAKIVYCRTKGLCACGCGQPIAPFPMGYHHAYPKAKWPELADHPMNIVGVAARCHANHESGYRRLPRHVSDLALEWCATSEADVAFLERVYGP